MNLYLWPAFFALVFKFWFIVSPKIREWGGKKWLALVGSYAALNFAELLLYSGYVNLFTMDVLLRFYYVCCVGCLLCTYHYIMDGENYPIQGHVWQTLFVFSIVLSGGFVFSDSLISGYVADSNPVVAVKEVGYPIFKLFALGTVALTLTTLFYNRVNAETQKEKIAYEYTIWAVMPLALSITLVVVFLNYGANANAIIPVATTLFLFITAKGKNSYLIEKDPRTLNPMSNEAKVSREMNWVQTQFAVNGLPLKESIVILEYALVQYKLKQNNGNVSKTARDLGVSRATLLRKLDKLSKH